MLFMDRFWLWNQRGMGASQVLFMNMFWLWIHEDWRITDAIHGKVLAVKPERPGCITCYSWTFYLWMDFNFFGKIIGKTRVFYMKFLFLIKSDKKYNMRAKNQNLYHFEQHNSSMSALGTPKIVFFFKITFHWIDFAIFCIIPRKIRELDISVQPCILSPSSAQVFLSADCFQQGWK
jgi:hypothetical protein